MPLPLSLVYVIFDAVVRYHCFVNVLLPPDKAIQYLCDSGLSSWHWHSRTGWGKQDKGTCLSNAVHCNILFPIPQYPKHAPALFSPLASRDQINLRNYWSLPAGTSGQSHCQGCSGKKSSYIPTKPIMLLVQIESLSKQTGVNHLPVIFLALVAGELQQLGGPWRLHALSCHLWNVTCHLYNRGSSAGKAGQDDIITFAEVVSKWQVSTSLDFLLCRLSPWVYFAPSPSSTWGALTALCGAAWFRGSSPKPLIRGNNRSLMSFTAHRPSSIPSTPSHPFPKPVLVHNYRWGWGGQALNAFPMST